MLRHRVRRGYCAPTSSPGDCTRDSKGTFDLSSRPELRSLRGCAALCAGCQHCQFVSFSKVNDDCSWYSTCPALHARHELAGAQDAGGESYLTVQVSNHSYLPPPARLRRAVVDNATSWLRGARPGYCSVAQLAGDCENDEMGTFGKLPARVRSAGLVAAAGSARAAPAAASSA